MNKIGDPGSVFFVTDRGQPMSLSMNLFLLRISAIMYGKFVFFYLQSMQKYIRSFAGGTSTQTITKEAVNELIFPICPLREQKLIVKKVDELFVICDTLKEKLKKSQTTQNQLADAIVELVVG